MRRGQERTRSTPSAAKPDHRSPAAGIALPGNGRNGLPDGTAADRFYEELGRLAEILPGPRRLRGCRGSDGWPRQGVYFFFEPGEVRADGSDRVVRVGTHALTATSQATLGSAPAAPRAHRRPASRRRQPPCIGIPAPCRRRNHRAPAAARRAVGFLARQPVHRHQPAPALIPPPHRGRVHPERNPLEQFKLLEYPDLVMSGGVTIVEPTEN